MTADFKLSSNFSIQDKPRLVEVVTPKNSLKPKSKNPLRKKYNRLFIGDNLLTMKQLLCNGYEKKFDLIYIDPPYFSQRKFSHLVKSKNGRSRRNFSYSDKWKNIDEYLDMLYERLLVIKKLLKDDGSVFVHLDWHVSHYVKIMLDEIFGFNNFRNEIAWCYFGPGSPNMRQFNREHQSIFWYSKSSKNWKFYGDSVRIPYKKSTLQKVNSKKNGFKGSVHDFSKGKIPEDWWSDIPLAQRFRYEVTNFETQKPKKLLERIITATTKSGDLVGDFFAGSGTTAVVAEEMGRKWVSCDISEISLNITKLRLNDNLKQSYLVESVGMKNSEDFIFKKGIKSEIVIKENSKTLRSRINLFAC